MNFCPTDNFKDNSNFKNKLHDIKAIIFDCDGTIVDSEHAHFFAWRKALKNQGYDLALEEYFYCVGKGLDALGVSFAKKIGNDNGEKIVKEKIGYFHDLQIKGLPPITATLNFIHRLVDQKNKFDLKLGVASAATKKEILAHLKNLKIESFFEVILSGQDDLDHFKDPEGVNKPKPYIYLQAAKMLGLNPSQCAVIEDSQTGITSAVSAGCIAVAVPNSFSQKQDFSKAHLQIDSFEKIEVADFLQMIQNLKIKAQK
ncbi:MAG: HAD family phosphatase [Chlamydiae bacterium]|nr:HAD family phosphatase [Chlamydiota bacterium]